MNHVRRVYTVPSRDQGSLNESILDENVTRFPAHFECQLCGDDEPSHSVCGAPVRGIPTAAAVRCPRCRELWDQRVNTCPAHGSKTVWAQQS